MEFKDEFLKAKVVNRYQRLIMDIKLDDNSLTQAFCSDDNVFPNLYTKGADLWVSRVKDRTRRLRYEVQAVNKGDGWVMVNQRYFHKLFAEALRNRIMPDFLQYSKVRRVTLADNLPHLDFELSNQQEKCFVSLRPIYNKQDGKAVFPTKVNLLDVEMFEEMKKVRAIGARTVVVLIVPRFDCVETLFSWTIDPVSAARIFDEAKNGLEFVSYGCNLDKKGINITSKLNICMK